MISIAVIDDGINEKRYNTMLKNNIEITTALAICNRTSYNPYSFSHGTVCAAIISKYMQDGFFLSSVKILNEQCKSRSDQLVYALQWCINNDIQLVNISLGTTDYQDFDKIKEITNYAYRKGLIIVAAINNSGVFTYPASLSNVVGVKCDKSGILSEDQHMFNEYPLDGIEITAYAKFLLTDYGGEIESLQVCNSFATPLITAKIGTIINKHPGIRFEDILSLLRNESVNVSKTCFNPYFRNKADWVDKAVVFQIFKKTKLAFSCCQYDVTDIIEIQCDTLKDGLKYISDYAFEAKLSMKNVDTFIVIINDLDEVKADYVYFFVSTMNELGKNIVLLDDKYPEYAKELNLNNIKIKLNKPDVGNVSLDLGNDAPVTVPIIVVYDFGNDQLINILAGLREQFNNDGYNALASANSMVGIYSGLCFLRLKNNINDYGMDIGNVLRSLVKVHAPDVFLIGIKIDDPDESYMKYIRESIDIDIEIFVSYPKWERLINNNKQNNPAIFVDKYTQKNLEKRDYESFSFLEAGYVKKLYDYIIKLFEDDNL